MLGGSPRAIGSTTRATAKLGEPLSEPDPAAPIPVPGRKSVQDYIDETPRWPDGTAAASVPLTRMQLRIWGLAAAGKFFEGMIVFMTGVALPLIAAEFDMNAVQRGIVGAASLFGILVGALALGSASRSAAITRPPI